MKTRFFTASAAILVLVYRNDVLDFLHEIEDTFLPLDPINYDFLFDLEETENGLIPKGTNLGYSNCSTQQLVSNETFAKGWSKVLYSLDTNAVVKFPNFEGRTYHNCFHSNFGKEDWEIRCRLQLLRGFVNEIKMLLRLQNDPNVVKIISYCIPSNPLANLENVNIVSERGTPLDVLHLLQLDTSQRVQLLQELLRFFANNRALRLHDFRRQQIVLVDGQPKIVDFDEAYVEATDTHSENCKFYLFRLNASTLAKYVIYKLSDFMEVKNKLVSELLIQQLDSP